MSVTEKDLNLERKSSRSSSRKMKSTASTVTMAPEVDARLGNLEIMCSRTDKLVMAMEDVMEKHGKLLEEMKKEQKKSQRTSSSYHQPSLGYQISESDVTERLRDIESVVMLRKEDSAMMHTRITNIDKQIKKLSEDHSSAAFELQTRNLAEAFPLLSQQVNEQSSLIKKQHTKIEQLEFKLDRLTHSLRVTEEQSSEATNIVKSNVVHLEGKTKTLQDEMMSITGKLEDMYVIASAVDEVKSRLYEESPRRRAAIDSVNGRIDHVEQFVREIPTQQRPAPELPALRAQVANISHRNEQFETRIMDLLNEGLHSTRNVIGSVEQSINTRVDNLRCAWEELHATTKSELDTLISLIDKQVDINQDGNITPQYEELSEQVSMLDSKLLKTISSTVMTQKSVEDLKSQIEVIPKLDNIKTAISKLSSLTTTLTGPTAVVSPLSSPSQPPSRSPSRSPDIHTFSHQQVSQPSLGHHTKSYHSSGGFGTPTKLSSHPTPHSSTPVYQKLSHHSSSTPAPTNTPINKVLDALQEKDLRRRQSLGLSSGGSLRAMLEQ